jgi:hypothetical protein
MHLTALAVGCGGLASLDRRGYFIAPQVIAGR